MPEKFEGTTTALITPLLNDGRVNEKNFRELVEYQILYGIHNLLVNGTTGEGPILPEEEWRKANRIVIETVVRRVPVLVGCGSIPTYEAIEKVKIAHEQGADGTLHDTGYKLGTSQLGFVKYFDDVARAAPIPVIMYDVRGRGHPAIEPATRIYIAQINKNVIGVKEASGEANKADWIETRRIAREAGFDRHSFKIISGDDPATYLMMTDPEVEGVGVISVWSNIFPREYSKLTKLLLEGRNEEARKIDESLKELNGLVTVRVDYDFEIAGKKYPVKDNRFRNPEAVQFAAYLLGMIESPTLISPQGILPREGQEKVGRALWNLYQTHENYFLPIHEFYRPLPSIGDRLKEYR